MAEVGTKSLENIFSKVCCSMGYVEKWKYLLINFYQQQRLIR